MAEAVNPGECRHQLGPSQVEAVGDGPTEKTRGDRSQQVFPTGQGMAESRLKVSFIAGKWVGETHQGEKGN